MTFRFLIPAVAAVVLFSASPASACPFCSPTGTTLTGEVAQADFIIFGSLSNATRDPNDPNSLSKGTTELSIDLVIKPNDLIKGKKSITIPRYVPPDGKNSKHLIFFNIFNGQLDPYRGEAVPADSKLPEYLKGAMEVKQKDIVTRLRYFFDYLEDPDIVVSSDAYSEFGYADYKDVREIGNKLSASTLLKWLKDPNTRGSRFGLYGLLLGHCGKPEDAKAIRALLDDKERSYTSGLDGVVAGYVLLDPKAGWEYLVGLIKDRQKDFPIKYAALKTVRFFWEFRPDIIPHADALAAIKMLMEDADIADMPIEDLRKWKLWDQTPAVLGLATKESHSGTPIIARAILKFAIAASWADPKNTAAIEYVNAARVKDPKRVQFLEEVLKDEQKPPTPPAGSEKKDPPKPNG
ncbi:MAG: hypothetical protein C0467_10000 [Planctomycetaceae bacterium]|nr:hypothetical protein [Planctomycetaceae bacterium]